MKNIAVAAVVTVLLAVTPAFAQVATPPAGTMTMSESGFRQMETVASGKITEIDLSKGTVTLDTGIEFALAPSLQYTSFPAVGQEVQVTYSEQGGQKVARVIDVGGNGNEASE